MYLVKRAGASPYFFFSFGRRSRPEPKLLSLPSSPASTALASRVLRRREERNFGLLDLSTAMCPTAIGVAHEVPKNSPPQVYDQMQAAPMLSCLILPSVDEPKPRPEFRPHLFRFERDNLDAF